MHALSKGSVSRIYKRWRNIGLHYSCIVEKMNLSVIHEKLETCNNISAIDRLFGLWTITDIKR